MSKDTRLEVIKALAYGVPLEDIANMAEVDSTEIARIKRDYADEIKTRRAEIEREMDNGNS